MTSKVQLICNGPSYVIYYTKRNAKREVIAQGQVRGGTFAQSFTEIYLGQDETLEATELYEPQEKSAPTAHELAEEFEAKHGKT